MDTDALRRHALKSCKLFSGTRIGQLELSHRLVTTIDARALPSAADDRRRPAPGGLVIAERLVDIAAVAGGWAKITDELHAAGALVVASLSPAAAQRDARDVDVDAAMDDYQRAARAARAAGFDGIELDARTGALAERFLHAATNSRDDDYGGNAERRMRFLLEAVHVVSAELSLERAGVRLSPCARGRHVEAFADVMRALGERELAYVHLATDAASIAACAERRAFRSDVSCALIASDFVDLDVAASAVEQRWADAVGCFPDP